MYFILGNKSSNDFDIIVKSINFLSTPSRNFEKVEVQGQDGALIVDHESYNNFPLIIECQLSCRKDKNINEVTDSMKEWLLGTFEFRKLYVSAMPEKYFEVIYDGALDIKEIIRHCATFTLNFIAKPYKRLFQGDEIITTLDSINLVNPTAYISKPYLKIFGSGDITININHQELILKDVVDYIEIDSEAVNASKGLVNENHKMFSYFPVFETGDNEISWSGDVNRIEIKPRWVSL